VTWLVVEGFEKLAWERPFVKLIDPAEEAI